MRRSLSVFSGGFCAVCGTHFSEKRKLLRHTRKCEETRLTTRAERNLHTPDELQEDVQTTAASATVCINELEEQKKYVSKMVQKYGTLVDQYRTSEAAIESVISTVTCAVTRALDVVHQELTEHITDKDLLQRAEKKAKQEAVDVGLGSVSQIKRKICDLAATMVRPCIRQSICMSVIVGG